MRDVPVLGAVFLCVTVVYGATLSANLTVAMDASWYLLHVVENRPEFHAHHLLYEHFASFVVAMLAGLWPGVDPQHALSMTNAVFGALCVTTIFAIIHFRCRLDLVSSLICLVPILFSFGMWYYSTTIEVYIIGIFLLLVSLYILSSENLSSRQWVLAGFFAGSAALFHQSYPLFGVVILVRIYLMHSSWRASLKSLALCAGTAAVAALGPYTMVVLLSPAITSENIVQWFLGYAASDQTFWHGLGLTSLAKAVAGFSRAMIGGFFLFAIPELKPMLAAVTGGTIEDHAFLTRNLGAWPARGLVFLSVCLAGSTVLIARRSIRAWRALEPRVKLPIILSLAWFLGFGVFFVMWEPHIPEFWIAQVACFWMALLIPALAKPAQGSNLRATYIPAVTAGMLVLAITWFGSVQFTQSEDNDYYRWRLSEIETEGGRGDLALVAAPWPASNMISLLTDVQPHFIRLPDIAPSVVSNVRNTMGSRSKIFVVYESPGGNYGPDLDTILSQVGAEPVRVRTLDQQGVSVLEALRPQE